jgi:hypothetical protein
MVGYDHYEQVRQEAQIRAKRIWLQHQWDTESVWATFEPKWVDEDRSGANENFLYAVDLSVLEEETIEGSGNEEIEEGEEHLAQLEDLCEDLRHLNYT